MNGQPKQQGSLHLFFDLISDKTAEIHRTNEYKL